MTPAIRWVVTLLLLGLLAAVVDLRAAVEVLRSSDPRWMALAVAVAAGDRLLMAGKWLPLLRIQLPDMPAGRAIKAYFASSFAAMFLPASVGADVLRAVGLGRDRDAVMEVGASVAFERVLGLVGAGIIALVALLIAFRADVAVGLLVPWALALVAVGIAAAVVPFNPRARDAVVGVVGRFSGTRWLRLLARFGSAYRTYRAYPRTLLVVGFLSTLEQLVPVLIFWAAALALGLAVPVEALVVAVPLALFAARLPISIAGIGIVEGGVVYLLGLFGVPSHEALSIALMARLAEIVAILPGSYWWKELTGRPSLVAEVDSKNPEHV